jgi:hypothetical protein
MLFRLLQGYHKIGSTEYKKGDTIETDVDLVKAFDAQRFERLDEDTLDREQPIHLAESEKTSVVPPVMDSKLGMNVTGQFDVAIENGFLVFRKGPYFYVAEPNSPDKKLNQKRLAKSKVEPWIADYLEG